MRKYTKTRLFTFVSFPGEDTFAQCAAEILHECTNGFVAEFQKNKNAYGDTESTIECIEEKTEQEECNAPIISDYVEMLEEVGKSLVIEEHNEHIIWYSVSVTTPVTRSC